MKKTVFLSVFSLLLLFAGNVEAQRFAYVNTDYILSKMNEFNDAQRQIDAIAKGWESDIEKKQAAIEAMYKDYERNQVLLTDDMRRKKENEILAKER